MGIKSWLTVAGALSPPLEKDILPLWDGNNQPGNELGFCDWPSQVGNSWTCSGGWDTFLYQVRPGLDSNSDTLIRVWAAHLRGTSFTNIWDMADINLGFEFKNGHNALICSAYMNDLNSVMDFY